jgi:hypothetical protein
MATAESSNLTDAEADQLDRLLALRRQLLSERDLASSPGVARALTVADNHLFMALGYFGYTALLFPEQS